MIQIKSSTTWLGYVTRGEQSGYRADSPCAPATKHRLRRICTGTPFRSRLWFDFGCSHNRAAIVFPENQLSRVTRYENPREVVIVPCASRHRCCEQEPYGDCRQRKKHAPRDTKVCPRTRGTIPYAGLVRLSQIYAWKCHRTRFLPPRNIIDYIPVLTPGSYTVRTISCGPFIDACATVDSATGDPYESTWTWSNIAVVNPPRPARRTYAMDRKSRA